MLVICIYNFTGNVVECKLPKNFHLNLSVLYSWGKVCHFPLQAQSLLKHAARDKHDYGRPME